ncbi:FtsK/SpoIIIE domain-containing protein [Streptomyces sp. CC228A]|uniref:FtsK/SpoIIIE domain-containing protein n=1 Tax=Streptomyces sp. CC228A TaxID=2898186 RepID=UPI0035A9398F
MLVEGPAGCGRTELLRSVAASLAAAARPDRLGLLLVDGAGERGEGLGPCTDLPHVSEYLVASDPVRMRAFAQALGAELKRRGELAGARHPEAAEGARPPLLVVLVDDLDALVAPALGSPGRPAAGSVVRALEAVARDGGRLGVHLVAASARPDRTAATEAARQARLRVLLDAPPAVPGPDDPAPGRGRAVHADGRVTPFQAGRVTGRIPRTSTLRPTVVPLEWERMGDPPPAARYANSATAPRTWHCWPVRWTGRPAPWTPARCPRWSRTPHRAEPPAGCRGPGPEGGRPEGPGPCAAGPCPGGRAQGGKGGGGAAGPATARPALRA